MESPQIYEEMIAEGLYPAWPELAKLTGSDQDKAAAQKISDQVWRGVSDDSGTE